LFREKLSAELREEFNRILSATRSDAYNDGLWGDD